MSDVKQTPRPKKATTPSVEGGDVANGPLSDREVDAILARIVGGRATAARLTYDVIMGTITAHHFREQVVAKFNEYGCAAVPLWTRSHWALLVLTAVEGAKTPAAMVVDSALGPATTRDWRRICRFLAVEPRITIIGRQRPSSQQCGLFVALAAVLLAGGADLAAFGHDDGGAPIVNLDPWRRADTLDGALTALDTDHCCDDMLRTAVNDALGTIKRRYRHDPYSAQGVHTLGGTKARASIEGGGALRNPGLMCYANSVVQLVAQTKASATEGTPLAAALQAARGPEAVGTLPMAWPPCERFPRDTQQDAAELLEDVVEDERVRNYFSFMQVAASSPGHGQHSVPTSFSVSESVWKYVDLLPGEAPQRMQRLLDAAQQPQHTTNAKGDPVSAVERLVTAPNGLIVIVRRFTARVRNGAVLHQKVHTPVTLGDGYLEVAGAKMRLKAIVEHIGAGVSEGHYKCHAVSTQGEMTTYDDSLVTRGGKLARFTNPYICVYERITPAVLDYALRASPNEPTDYVSDSVINASVARVMEAQKITRTVLTTDETNALLRAATSPQRRERTLQAMAKRLDVRGPMSCVYIKDGHYVAFVADATSNAVRVLDTLPGHIRPEVVLRDAATIAVYLAAWRTDLGPPTAVFAPTYRQRNGSNDCGPLALAAACAGRPVRQPRSRRDLEGDRKPRDPQPEPALTADPKPTKDGKECRTGDEEKQDMELEQAPADVHESEVVEPTVDPPRATIDKPRSAMKSVQTEAQQAAKPDAPIAHTNVAARVAKMHLGTIITVEWSMGAESGEWTLRLDKHRTHGIPAKATCIAIKCQACGELHGTQDDPAFVDPVDLPWRPVQYRRINERPPATDLPTLRPDCMLEELDQSEDDEEEGSPDEKKNPELDQSGDGEAEDSRDGTKDADPPRKGPATDEHQGRAAGQRAGPGNARREATDPDTEEQERQPLMYDLQASTRAAAITRRWYIYSARQKPEHVHAVAWNRVCKPTRETHVRWLRRLQHFGSDSPLPTAAIDCVMQLSKDAKRGPWTWATIAGALSAIASACMRLPMYTTATRPVNLKEDPAFRDAMARACHLAKTTAVNTPKPMTQEQVEAALRACKTHKGYTLLAMAWEMGVRVSDMRRAQRRKVAFGDTLDVNGARHVMTTITFVEGKGAAFWGPWSVACAVPVTLQKRLREAMDAAASDGAHIFSAAAQRDVSNAVHESSGLSLLSVRRGALVQMSAAGATDREVQLASGHKSVATLARYLGWGAASGEAANAAMRRAELRHEVRGGEAPPQEPQSRTRPMVMGDRSGLSSIKGRRVAAPPSFMPKRPPSSAELGLVSRQDLAADAKTWPLQLRDVPPMDYRRLVDAIKDSDLRQAATKAIGWLSTPDHYGVGGMDMARTQVPVSRFTYEQWQQFVEGKRISPLRDRPIRCTAKGFPAPQVRKKNARPVWEPSNNSLIDRDQLPPMGFASRHERRQQFASRSLRLDFDFVGYFDTILLGDDVAEYYVVRSAMPVPDSDGTYHTLWHLTREPMGSTHSAHIAQTLTWSILEDVLIGDLSEGVDVVTMLDNVGIASDDEEKFVDAVLYFVRRCDEFGATLHGRADMPAGDDKSARDAWLARARAKVAEGCVFLGEEYRGKKVRNAAHHVDKLRQAFTRIQRLTDTPDPTDKLCAGHVLSTIALANWMASTTEVLPAAHYEVRRLYQAIARDERLDREVTVSGNMLTALANFVAQILRNTPTVPTPPRWFGTNEDYDVVLCVDASASGWGAHVRWRDGTVIEMREGWPREMPHSAHAEPTAAGRVIEIIRGQQPNARIAVVTDHEPIPARQRHPRRRTGGTSAAFHLNHLFHVAYGTGQDVDFFWIDGDRNTVADTQSRSVHIGDRLSIRRSTAAMVRLETCDTGVHDAPRARWCR